jgi:hypothetical protein
MCEDPQQGHRNTFVTNHYATSLDPETDLDVAGGARLDPADGRGEHARIASDTIDSQGNHQFVQSR